jgi:hypothetical protein
MGHATAFTGMTAHMGMFEVKGQVYGFMGSSPAVGYYTATGGDKDPARQSYSASHFAPAPN